jgi:hypothetical protein
MDAILIAMGNERKKINFMTIVIFKTNKHH